MNDFRIRGANNFVTTRSEFNREFNRRHLLGCIVGVASICLLKNTPVMAQSNNAQDSATALRERYDNLLQTVLSNEEMLESARGERDRYTAAMPMGLDVLNSTLESRLPPSSTQISQRATDLLIQFEVSNESLYKKKYQNPTWPGGPSGVTIGIGYDIGYISRAFLKEDWQGLIPDDVIEMLSNVCGKKGQSARGLLEPFRDIKIDWETAQNQFLKRNLPLYIADTEAALKNTNLLPLDSLGALVSLVYNRGASFSNPNDDHLEMRNIKAHMVDKEFSKIPDEFRAMKYLWDEDHKNLPGLITRRELEALLFEHGLATT